MQGQPMQGQPMQGQPMQGQPMNPNQGAHGAQMMGGPQNMALVGMQPSTTAGMIPVITKEPKTGIPIAWTPNNADGSHALQYIQAVTINQKISTTEIASAALGCAWEKPNKYDITDLNTGFMVGKFVEESGCCQRNCCKANRAFKADIQHHSGYPLFKIDRRRQCICTMWCYTCGGGVGDCIGNSMTVSDVNGSVIGYVELARSFELCFGATWLKILNADREVQYKIGGNHWSIACGKGAGGMCGDKHVQLLDKNGERISTIVKKWKGILQEGMTDADTLQLYFPDEADVNMKACLIAGVLLFDYLVFEKKE